MVEKLRVYTGLSVIVAGVLIAAKLDDASRTVRIVTQGEPAPADVEAVAAARVFLAGRVRRVLPGWRVKG